MTSNKPYILRALYEWIKDNQMTPYVLLDAEMKEVEVPHQYVEDGKIILNIATSAVQSLVINNQSIEFSASFSGIPTHVYAPIKAVLAIYARENGRGMVFSQELDEEDDGDKVVSRKPKLTVIK